MEKGVRTISEDIAERICDTVPVNRDWFLKGLGNPGTALGSEGEGVSDRVREVRKLYGMTQKALAEALGCTLWRVIGIENRSCQMPRGFLRLMAEKLNVSYLWLKTGDGEMQDLKGNTEVELHEIERKLRKDEEKAAEQILRDVFGGDEELASRYAVVKSSLYGRTRITLLAPADSGNGEAGE